MKTLDEIESWIIHVAGILPTSDNHFGTDINAQPVLNLKLQQRPSEIARCIKFFLDKKEQGEILNYYAEIGACSGGTTRAFQEFLQFYELLIIDDGGAHDPMYVSDRDDQLRGQNLNFIPRVEIIGSSLESRVINHAHHLAQRQLYDILLIDGDHSYNGVRSDTINYYPIVRKGGYIIYHDTAHIADIQRWLLEIPLHFGDLKLLETFADKSQFTNAFPNGIGITVFQKI